MLSTKKFLDKYDLLLFDMDGVITSEQGYWTTAALVIYILVFSNEYFGSKSFSEPELIADCDRIRREIFANGKTISVLKDKGVNSNWDLAYITAGLAIAADTTDFDRVYEIVSTLSNDIFAEYDKLADTLTQKFGGERSKYERGGELWQTIREIFQRIYVGDGSGAAIINSEKPLHSLDKTTAVLKTLSDSGKLLGVGSGRPFFEVKHPLSSWGVYNYFDANKIVTYDSITADENILNEKGIPIALTKPHPYMFLKGMLGLDFPIDRLLGGDYDKAPIAKTLVIGDAGADMYAAKAAGFDFLAVLTGVAGQNARAFFEGKADYILNSVCDMIEDI